MNSTQPRTPAGSPAGGQFAATAGAESTTGVPPSGRINSLVDQFEELDPDVALDRYEEFDFDQDMTAVYRGSTPDGLDVLVVFRADVAGYPDDGSEAQEGLSYIATSWEWSVRRDGRLVGEGSRNFGVSTFELDDDAAMESAIGQWGGVDDIYDPRVAEGICDTVDAARAAALQETRP